MPAVSTIEAKCKRCYSCVFNCPAKAIRVEHGQAKVMEERCIACGNCVKVCAQNAKQIKSGIEHSWELLSLQQPVFAILAPSFPSVFPAVEPGQVIAACKKLGFAEVLEVAFGADLIAQEYRKLVESEKYPIIISSPCPAIINYIEKHHSSLLEYLAPIVSPMIACGRVIKQKYAPDAKIIFIGPCIAKKKEIEDSKVSGVIDEVLTFTEFQQMLVEQAIKLNELEPCEFDGPISSMGRIFPVAGGLLKTAALQVDVFQNDTIVTDGKNRIVEIINKLEQGHIEARFLDLLFCDGGCINGPAIDNELSVFSRKNIVANYTIQKCKKSASGELIPENLADFQTVNLRREFTNENILLPLPAEEQIKAILARMNKFEKEDELNCGACGYPTCREKAIAVFQGLAEEEMCLHYLIEKQEEMNQQILQTQERLIRSAKMTSMGELAAGVAHEINNPLTGVLTYIKLMLKKMNIDQVPTDDLAKFRKYLATMETETIRCSEIVKNLLDFARPTRPAINLVHIDEIITKSLFLVKHQIELQNIEIHYAENPGLPPIKADLKQMQQVLLNLFINAAQAMPNGGKLTIKTEMNRKAGFVSIAVADSGSGIDPENLNKIFDPFFTTKADRKGTGLGLSVVYGIIASHQGTISVESEIDQGTTFMIKLPTDEQYSKYLSDAGDCKPKPKD